MSREATVRRETKETQIEVRLDLDGTGTGKVSTGIGFFDHMLDLFARHGLFNLDVEARGDLHIDAHHTVEDTGIVLGQAFSRALGEKVGIVRYGHFLLPMDEALVRVVVDISGRPYLGIDLPQGLAPVGSFPVQLVEEFLRAFATNAGLTLHVAVLSGRDSHHICESIFKGLARALEMAVRVDPRVSGVPSTKGLL
jgi:imidazoleglycerol-phosphate dehydratase